MKLTYLELLGQKHPMCFSVSATEEICDAFGDLDGMTKAIDAESTAVKLKAADTVLQILLRAGRNYCKAAGIDMPPPLPCRPADLIDVTDSEAIRSIFATISNDTQRTIEAKPKNGAPTQD